MMELRRYREGDIDALARVGVAAFGGSVSDWEKNFDPAQNARLDLEQVHVIEEDGEVRASTTVLPLESFVEGEWRPIGGISAVMAHPAYRRRGYAGKLMRAVLRDMRERGVSLSLLSPFAHAFYRIFGYELTTEDIEYKLKPADLPTSPEQSHLRAYREEDLSALMDLYTAEAKRHTLSVRRSEAHWKKSLADKDKDVAVYEGDGDVEGYILYKISGWQDRDPRRTLTVDELVAGTVRAREALLSFMAGLDPLVYGIKHFTPRGEPLHPYLSSSHVNAKIEPDQMLRLVDVEGALGYLERVSEAPLVLDISDDVIPENAGAYTFGDGKIVRGTETGESVSLDVRQLAQLYAGYLPARDLARHGLVRASSPEALDLLEALFPLGDPWLYGPDHF
ncbi:MAG: GNAT family N-acetyltransferase [Actinomycetota bacterium]|jgi:predicted acetyltransferase|nr:GNAT family N-acetyltransferase [Rubrobacteraceae bacterium]MDQ3183077.1 GNAT family N-acetyltransferase [Actinomycetota bacterium]MDQ3498900.1 GNAT family N-acetyltransferase [Actinomycetota bacterium]